MDVGTGYRIGLGIGVLSRLSARFGLLFELEAAHQHVSHIRHFARRDGSADEVELPITYDLRWLGAEVRFGIFPVSVVVRQESINERFSAVPLRAASRAWRSSM